MWSQIGFIIKNVKDYIWIVCKNKLSARGIPLKISGHQEVGSVPPHVPFPMLLDLHFINASFINVATRAIMQR